jgi:glycosyltransferase involved in cell wall biosynthesis
MRRNGEVPNPRGGLSHPFGNENVYNAVVGLQRAGLLKSFETCLFMSRGSTFRTHPDIDRSLVRQHRVHEVVRLAACYSRVFSGLGRSQSAVDYVNSQLDRTVSRKVRADDAFWYCYEDGALDVFRAAKQLNVPTFYELPAPFFASSLPIYHNELAEYPALEPFFPQLKESEEKAERKWEELRLADTVVCASTFTASSLEGAFPETERVIVGYGTESPADFVITDVAPRRLRIVFVGLLGPRKGLHRLFEALKGLPADSWELSLLGSWVPGFDRFLADRFPSVRYHYHGQQPRAFVRSVFLKSDVLVLPSLSEGYGLVLSEAMAHGVAAIGSTHTAIPDLLGRRSGVGIVPAGSTEAIQLQLEAFIRDRGLLLAHRKECLESARRRTWDVYGDELAGLVRSRMRKRDGSGL